MPKYLARFFLETPLRADHDIRLTNNGHDLCFLFRTGNNTPFGVEVELVCEGENWRDACLYVSESVIPPVLDAIAFHRKTHLALGGCRKVLKSEGGLERRKVIFVNPEKYSQESQLDPTFVAAIQSVVDTDPEARKLSLRWLRSSYQPLPVVDRFIYSWLSLETLAGERLVTKKCQACSTELPSYKAADRDAAFAILRSCDPDLEQKTFADWWNRLRNSVFHGGKEPDASFMKELADVAARIQQAVELFLEKKLKVRNRNRARTPFGPEFRRHMWLFLEFDGSGLKQEFAERTPRLERVLALLNSHKPTEEEMGCRTLGERAIEDW